MSIQKLSELECDEITCNEPHVYSHRVLIVLKYRIKHV